MYWGYLGSGTKVYLPYVCLSVNHVYRTRESIDHRCMPRALLVVPVPNAPRNAKLVGRRTPKSPFAAVTVVAQVSATCNYLHNTNCREMKSRRAEFVPKT